VIRGLAALFVAGLLLSSCGSVSPATAMRSWVTQSGFRANTKVLEKDAAHSATALRAAATTRLQLHTVCGVLLYDTQTSNASLPTPDAQATSLLSRAYTELGAGANECYKATSVSDRATALASLAKGGAALAEGSARVASVVVP
jgi:hypothetical protein